MLVSHSGSRLMCGAGPYAMSLSWPEWGLIFLSLLTPPIRCNTCRNGFEPQPHYLGGARFMYVITGMTWA